MTAFEIVAYNGNVEIMQLFLQSNTININYKDSEVCCNLYYIACIYIIHNIMNIENYIVEWLCSTIICMYARLYFCCGIITTK